MEQVKQILRYYDLGGQDVLNYESHSHDPDMWSDTFEVDGKKYLLVEVEAISDDLSDEEYDRLEDDLGIKRTDLKLIMPKLEQMHTVNNRAGIGIDGHRALINAEDATKLHAVQEEARAKRYFPPVSDEELPNWELKKYKNPYGLHSDITWVLFEIQANSKIRDLLTEDEAEKVEWGEVLNRDYFYLPVIYYSERSPDDEAYWHSLRFNKQELPASLLAYASKVPAGKTLWQAVRHDFEVDFNYARPRSFAIEQAKPFDTAKTKDGRELTRFLVWVGVYEKFDTASISPVGTKPFWVDEGEHLFNPIANKYFNDLPSSDPDDERAEIGALPFGKYLDPNKLGELKVLIRRTIHPAEPEDLYLIQDTKNDDLYCCYDIQDHTGGGPSDEPRYMMRTFLAGNYKDGHKLRIEMLKPKNKDWFVTCYIARVHKG